jgi:hypothetical protein
MQKYDLATLFFDAFWPQYCLMVLQKNLVRMPPPVVKHFDRTETTQSSRKTWVKVDWPGEKSTELGKSLLAFWKGLQTGLDKSQLTLIKVYWSGSTIGTNVGQI